MLLWSIFTKIILGHGRRSMLASGMTAVGKGCLMRVGMRSGLI